MLYLYRHELLLVELKGVPFCRDIIEQINDYCNELLKLQSQSKLVKANINKIILVTAATEEQTRLCRQQNIRLVKFNIEELLSKYYANFRELSAFLNIQPANRGVSHLYLIKPTFYAEELGFIHQIDDNVFLTPCGIQAILIFQLNRSIQLIKARA